MKSFNLPTLIGNPADTTLTFAKLIFGGVLECFPKLKFLLAHAGGFLPYTWGWLDRGYQIQAPSDRKISKPPGEYIKLLYFDTIPRSKMTLEYLVANFDSRHLVLGSDYPYDMGRPGNSANPARNKHLDRRKEEYLQRNRPQASRYRVLTMCEF